jgi:hypothetical protein
MTVQGASLRKQWSDKFIPTYKQILATHLAIDPDSIRTATHEEDYLEATDLVLPDGRTVAAKTRRASILSRYPDEFALRCRAPGGHKSEWAKVRDDKRGDLLLYTYSDEGETMIQKWRLFDLDVLRVAQRSWFEDAIPDIITIPDQDISLISFNWRQIALKYGRILLAEGIL